MHMNIKCELAIDAGPAVDPLVRAIQEPGVKLIVMADKAGTSVWLHLTGGRTLFLLIERDQIQLDSENGTLKFVTAAEAIPLLREAL